MKKMIYIADDQDSIRGICKVMLGRDECYDVKDFPDGSDLLKEYDKEKPALVITDNIMPITKGVDVIKHIRESVGDLDTPIIFMTGYSDGEDIDYASSQVKTRVIHKPFGMEILDHVSEMIGE